MSRERLDDHRRIWSEKPFGFLHPATPARVMDGVARVGRALETIPLFREIAGSMVITAMKPRAR